MNVEAVKSTSQTVRLDINRAIARKRFLRHWSPVSCHRGTIGLVKEESSFIFSWNPGENGSLLLELVSPTANGDVAKKRTAERQDARVRRRSPSFLLLHRAHRVALLSRLSTLLLLRC